MLQSLIQKQLAADFPDQAADLQALQDVSSSVSTNDSPTVWETIKTESADVVAGIVETFFERYEEDPEGFHNGLRLLDPVTEIARANGLLDSDEYRQFEQVIDEATGKAITAFQPYALDASTSQVGKMRVSGPALAQWRTQRRALLCWSKMGER